MDNLDFSQWSMNNSASALMNTLRKNMNTEKANKTFETSKILTLVKTIEEKSRLLGKYEGHSECDRYAEEAEDMIKMCYDKLNILVM